jgi:hypothetical protein
MTKRLVFQQPGKARFAQNEQPADSTTDATPFARQLWVFQWLSQLSRIFPDAAKPDRCTTLTDRLNPG